MGKESWGAREWTFWFHFVFAVKFDFSSHIQQGCIAFLVRNMSDWGRAGGAVPAWQACGLEFDS